MPPVRQPLLPGDPAPDFRARSSASETLFSFNTVAGRYIVLGFFGSTAIEKNAAILRYALTELRPMFDDEKLSYFGVSVDPADEKRLQQSIPGVRFFWDTDREVSRAYGLLGEEAGGKDFTYTSCTLVLDPFMRVLAVISMADAAAHNAALKETLEGLPAIDDHAGVELSAPVLVLPRVFEPGFCRELIGLYNQHGGIESGFMRERDGQTVGVLDTAFKRRKDFSFDTGEEFEKLRSNVRARLKRRLIPAILKAFQFEVTRIERYTVACYNGESGGFFRPHRDNTTRGTAHRRFACTLNLNAEEYEGGNLRFPEFGTKTYRAPTGGAVVFSCSLLHEATPVTNGLRYAFLPFLYDDAAAKIRDENRQFVKQGFTKIEH
ncbi:MAG: 2OG-Fe(II) oxygenase [Alphaproteobacteria bacterium]